MRAFFSFVLFSLALVCFPFSSVSAQDIGLVVEGKNLGQHSGLSTNSVSTTAIQIINTALGLLAILCTGLMIYAGFLWMTAGGNDEKVEKAKKTIWACVLGLLIILSAWGISSFVLGKTYKATTANTTAEIF